MRLINTSTLALVEFHGDQMPEYAILSHTWSAGELTYQEAVYMDTNAKSKPGFLKVQRFCAFAKDRGFDLAWIDTCCIDKQSSAELTEAINSMFQWYQSAQLCVIHLDDLKLAQRNVTRSSKQNHVDLLRNCRWFTRGWTLQELIASRKRVFVASDWQVIDLDEAEVCSSITGIDRAVLFYTRKPTQACVAERMSWAATRETSRVEDRAYSLMGLFQVSMPILYGEGEHNAFRRLQEEIMKKSFDQTIFAWRASYDSSGLLARSPSDFQKTPKLSVWAPDALSPYSMTNVGILIRLCLFDVTQSEDEDIVSALLQCDIQINGSWRLLAITLQRIPETYCWVNGKKCEAFRRIRCSSYAKTSRKILTHQTEFSEILVLEDEHFNLAQQSVVDNVERWSNTPQPTVNEPPMMNDSTASTSTEHFKCVTNPRPHFRRMQKKIGSKQQIKFRPLETIARRVQRSISSPSTKTQRADDNSSDAIIEKDRERNNPPPTLYARGSSMIFDSQFKQNQH